MVYYYLNPEPDKTPKMILKMSREGILNMGSPLAPLIGFFSRIFAQNPARLKSWISELDGLPEDQKRTLWLSLWYADTPEASDQLRRAAEKTNPLEREQLTKLLHSRPPIITAIEINDPGVLDMLWGAFMATGDQRYVIRIMSALPWVNEKRETTKLLPGGAARWSMTSNCVQHEKVLKICRDQLTKQPPQVTEVLNDIIREAEAEKRKRKNSK